MFIAAAIISWFFISPSAFSFGGRIQAAGGSGGATGLLYTMGTNFLRVEMTDTNFPNAIDIVDPDSGRITLVQPMFD